LRLLREPEGASRDPERSLVDSAVESPVREDEKDFETSRLSIGKLVQLGEPATYLSKEVRYRGGDSPNTL